MSAKQNLNKNIWEGWTPQDFITVLLMELDMIMMGQTWKSPFKTRDELISYIIDNQPYYKESINEVNNYFIERYGL